ncbi:MAG TPA: nucleotide exchange factor GrpE [Micromonosporaceae bacterium]
MTDESTATGPDDPGPESAAAREEGQGDPGERVVIRDKRKINPAGGRGKAEPSDQPAAAASGAGGTGSAEPAPTTEPEGDSADAAQDSSSEPGPEVDTAEAALVGEPAETAVDEPAAPVEEEATEPVEAELAALRAELEERTSDLQRVTAEYANYRRRVDRDRAAASEQAVASVLTALLPVLDDLDRAREHGDLVGPFGAVAEQLASALAKFGLTAFGEKGDPFDPNRHEAVAHSTSSEVTGPTCIEVMRRGYLLGDRLLRPALVAVADPE